MSNAFWSFIIGCVVTAGVAGFSSYYLTHKKNKTAYTKPNTLLDTIEAVDYRFNDLKYKLQKPRRTEAPVVLLAIDDESVQEIGRWPWSRDLISSIVEELVDNGASSVGLDIIFSEPEKAYPENDTRLANLVAKYPEKIILGTYSDNNLSFLPYQDYCVTEAFLKAGGDQLVKISASLVIDDEGEVFDDIPWDQIFPSLFATISADTRVQYLSEHNKKNISELTQFQRNHLEAITRKEWFAYCSKWLTANDYLFQEHKTQLLQKYSEVFIEKLTEHGDNIEAKLDAFKAAVKEHPTPQYGEWVPNILEIQTPAQMTGSFVTDIDVDGVIRRYPLFFRSGNRIGTSYIPSLALNMYLASKNLRSVAEVKDVRGRREITSFKIFDSTDGLVQELPIDKQGRVMIKYYGPQRTLPYVSAKDLLSDDPYVTVTLRDITWDGRNYRLEKFKVLKKEYFKNRAVVFGATSMGIYDLRNTPVETNFPGPEIHVSMLANFFEHNFLQIVPYEHRTLPLLILGLGLVLSALLARLGAVHSMLSFGGFIVAGAVVDYFIFTKYNLVYSGVFVFFLIGIQHSVAIVYKYLSEERKKAALKRTFSKYVSPAVVDEILKAEDNLKLGGKKQEMTVFFSDVRGFTKFSEKMDPAELTQFLNEYLTPMTEVIFNNKGTLDKYMGDGLMAFFGAPIPHTDHAYSACRAALDSLDKLAVLKQEFKKKNWPEIDIGIGINTGIMSVGNMGSQIVQSYTVIGDAVNLGARLEGTTKQYGARILVSESTYNATKNSFLFREVDRVRVVGKKEPVGAFELLSDVKSSGRTSYIDRYHEAYHLYVQRQFAKALAEFEKLEKEEPLDLLVRIYKNRCIEFIADPPQDDWDGVHEMKAK